MSQNAFTPPSRPPSSASASSSSSSSSSPSSSSSSSSSITSANNLPRVHASAKISYGGGHDHTRPLPPPRLSEPTAITTISSSSSLTIAPLTAPLAPLSANASFRSNNSRNSTISGTSGTATTSNNNNNLSNNNINNNNNSNNNNNNNNNNSSSNNHNNNSNNNGTSTGRQIQSSVVASPTNLSRVSATRTNNLGEVTLTVPRPELERVVNEYVETPFRQVNSPTTCPVVGNHVASNQKCLKNERRLQQQQQQQQHHHHHHHHHHRHNHQHHHQHHEREQQSQEEQQQQQRTTSGGGDGGGGGGLGGLGGLGGDVADSRGKSPTSTTGGAVVSAQARNRDNGARRQQSHLLQSSLSVTSSGGTVTKQPVSFTKEPSNVLGSSSIGAIGGRLNDPNLSIMCDFCGRCRCESCREPPPLPSRWLCNNSCFCSAETALDYVSCLCCVKGLFYHCADSGSGTDSEAGGNCADEPCSCTGPRRTARWACLGALTLVLPCLLCYWPLKGCVTLCEACYARHASQGCRCDPTAHGRHHNPGAQSVVSRDSRDPEKRLLDPVTPEL